MTELARREVVPARKGTPALTLADITELLPLLGPDWAVDDSVTPLRLRRQYAFRDFNAALQFTLHIGERAEAADHHPAILTEWGKVTVSWWTHSIGGLHLNDFIMAARCDEVYAGP